LQNTLNFRYFSQSIKNQEIIIEDNEIKEMKDKISNIEKK
jgi:hypothetical protein